MMEEIDRFQVPAVRAEMQPLVRGGRGRAVPGSRRRFASMRGGWERGGRCRGWGSAEAVI